MDWGLIELRDTMSSYSLPDGLSYVSVKFMDDNGVVRDRRPGRPVVQVVLRYAQDAQAKAQVPENPNPAYALLDTGADYNYGTAEAIGMAQCPQIGSSTTRCNAGSIASTQHRCHLYFPEAKVQLETDIFSVPLSNSSATKDLVVGMLTIECGALVLDFKKDIYRLYLG
jgi:hypothetical protein